jgi:hypothetical protein
MRIAKDELVAGHPALRVRCFIRRYRVGVFMTRAAENLLGINSPQAKDFLRQLVSLGLTKPAELTMAHVEPAYELTSRG